MEFTNLLGKIVEIGSVSKVTWDEAIKNLLILIAPSAPHMAEELWVELGNPYSIHNQLWPKWDKELASDEEVTLVIQINGKVREKLVVPDARLAFEVTDEHGTLIGCLHLHGTCKAAWDEAHPSPT